MANSKFLISTGAILLLTVVALILIWYYQSRFIEPELVSPTEISPVKIPASTFVEHINEGPDGGGGTKIYERAESLNSVSKTPQDILPVNSFINHTAEPFGDTGTAIYVPMPEVHVGPIVSPSTMVKNVEEFPQE